MESGMLFLGFLVMKNVLKAETAPVIHSLRRAEIRTVMVTGREAGPWAGRRAGRQAALVRGSECSEGWLSGGGSWRRGQGRAGQGGVLQSGCRGAMGQ